MDAINEPDMHNSLLVHAVLDHGLLTAFLLIVAVTSSYLIRQALAPIAKLPGPFLTKFTVLPIVWQDYRNNRTRWTESLHEQYGPLVRISPHEVSACSFAHIRDVFTGSVRTGYYAKAPIFNNFQHYGARNAFSSIETEAHGWRRKIVAGNYAQTAIVAKELKYGHLWKAVGNFVDLIKRQGVTTAGATTASKSIDYFGACRYFAADNITSHLFSNTTHALEDLNGSRSFLEASQESPGDVLTYFRMEFEALHATWRSFIWRFGWMVGVKAPSSGRGRTSTTAGRKLDNLCQDLVGGTAIRDWTFKRFIDVRQQVEDGTSMPASDEAVATRLAANVIAGDRVEGTAMQNGRDAGTRIIRTSSDNNNGPSESQLFYTDYGCASECMDQFLAGLDTVGDTLAYTFYVLSWQSSARYQRNLIEECRLLDLPASYDGSLPSKQLHAIQNSPWIEAVLKETLRRFPASTTSLQRVVPKGGRVLNGYFVPEDTIIGATPTTPNAAAEVFDRSGKYDIEEWRPERWIDVEPDILAEMNRRLWTFGSGGRGCIGKQ